MANQIWIDGVQVDVHPGDVSALEEDLRKAINQGGAWFTFPIPAGHYTIRVAPTTSVIVRYGD